MAQYLPLFHIIIRICIISKILYVILIFTNEQIQTISNDTTHFFDMNKVLNMFARLI